MSPVHRVTFLCVAQNLLIFGLICSLLALTVFTFYCMACGCLWVCHAHSHVNTHRLQYCIGVVLTDTHCLAGSAIEASLKQLAERRTDIFGVGDEETAIGKKIGEEDKRKDEKVLQGAFKCNA